MNDDLPIPPPKGFVGSTDAEIDERIAHLPLERQIFVLRHWLKAMAHGSLKQREVTIRIRRRWDPLVGLKEAAWANDLTAGMAQDYANDEWAEYRKLMRNDAQDRQNSPPPTGPADSSDEPE